MISYLNFNIWLSSCIYQIRLPCNCIFWEDTVPICVVASETWYFVNLWLGSQQTKKCPPWSVQSKFSWHRHCKMSWNYFLEFFLSRIFSSTMHLCIFFLSVSLIPSSKYHFLPPSLLSPFLLTSLLFLFPLSLLSLLVITTASVSQTVSG